MKEKESKRYQEMMKEVEGIIKNLSSDSIDLDDMIVQVEHGYSLIKSMRGRLDEARKTIEKIKLEYEPKVDGSP